MGTGLEIFVSVGTDRHPFDRLVEWADAHALSHPEDRVVVQHGWSTAPVHAIGHQLFGRADMAAQLASADVVVVSGGPGAVMDARRAGRLPAVAPRDPAMGEHVDGHQLSFARHLHRQGLAMIVENEDDLRQLIERARRDPAMLTVEPDGSEPLGISRIGALIDELVHDD